MEVADDAVPIAAEAQRVSVQVPEHRGPAHGDIALDHDGEYVLAADKASIKEGKAGGHQHDEAGTQDHESGVAGVKMKHVSPFRKLENRRFV